MGAYYGLGLGLAGAPSPVRGSHIGTFSTAARDYFIRLNEAGVRVTKYDQANARLIDRLVANGGNFWPDSGAFNAMAGYLYPGNGEDLIPLHPNHDAGTLNAFVTGDWNAVTGLKGDRSTKYVDSNRNNNADGQNDQAMGVYFSDVNNTGTFKAPIGADDNHWVSRLDPDLDYLIRNRNSTSNLFTELDPSTGYEGMSRDNNSDFDFRTDGTTRNFIRASQTPVGVDIFVFGRNLDGLSTPTNARLPFYHIGPNLNGTGELAELDSILTDWKTDLANA